MMKHLHNFVRLLAVPAILAFCGAEAIAQPLNGTYTVGGTTPNYATPSDAITDLNAKGVSGPVTFNIRTGTYTMVSAQRIINAVTGSSAANRVTFQSETGDPTNVKLQFNGNAAADNYVLRLNNASNISVKNISLENTATATYATALSIAGTSSSDSVVNCNFSTALTTISTSNNLALIFANSVTGSNNVFVDNDFTLGTFGIYLSGSSTTAVANGWVMASNTFTNQKYRAVFAQYADNAKFINNTFVSNGSLTSGYTGIYSTANDLRTEYVGNSITVNCTSSGTMYGMYVTGCVATATEPARMVGNTVTMTNTSSATAYGIYQSSSPYDSILNNNVTVTTTSSGASYSLYNTSSANSYIKDNTLFAEATGTGSVYLYSLNSSANSYLIDNTITLKGANSTVYHYGAYSGSTGSEITGNTMTLSNTSTSKYVYNYLSYSSNQTVLRQNDIEIDGLYYIENYMSYSGTGTVVDDNDIDMYTSGSGYVRNYMCYTSTNATITDNRMVLTKAGTTSGYIYNYMYYGSSSTTLYGGATITGNTVTATASYYSYPFYLYYFRASEASNNTLNSTAYYNYGFYMANGTNSELHKNKITCKGTASTTYGLYVPSANNCKFTNNSVYASGTSTTYALYFSANNDCDYIGNTIVSTSTSSNYAGYMSTSATSNLKIYNNIFAKVGGSGYMFYHYNNYLPTDMDHNLFYSTGTYFYNAYSGLQSNSIPAIRAINGANQNSLLYDVTPAFNDMSTGDLSIDPSHVASWAVNGRATHYANFVDDLAGTPRPTTRPVGVPDIGAYEVVPAVTPPNCFAVPTNPNANGTQYFYFGEDTVASIKWGPTVPATLVAKQYPGVMPPAYTGATKMYNFIDFITTALPDNYVHELKFYYKDPQLGTIAAEAGMRLIQDSLRNGTWYGYTPSPTGSSSLTDAVLNTITTTAKKGFGYHSGSDMSNNASVTRLAEPDPFCSPSSKAIKVTIKNHGNNTINNVQIGYTINGGPATTINHTTPLQTSLVQPDSAVVTLTNYNFTTSQPINLVAYTFSPNGQPDANRMDDTLRVTIWPGLNGVYYVGTAPAPAPPADFPDVKTAIDVMNRWGICGPVTFKIRDGVYTGGGVIAGPITGSSAVNRVTFESENGVAANVTINNNFANAVFGMDDVSYVTLRNLTITSTSLTAITMSGAPSYDTIVGCNISAGLSTNTAAANAVISGMNTSFAGNYNTFLKNKITGSTTGIYLYSPSTASMGRGNVIDSNEFSGQYYYGGVYLYYQKSPKVRGNSSVSGQYNMYMYQILTDGNNPIEIIGNTITKTTAGYAAYFYYITGTANTRAQVAYNKVNATPGNTYTYTYLGYYARYADIHHNTVVTNATYGYGIAAYYSNYTNIFNNTVDMTTSSSTTYGIYAYNMTQDSIYNNTVRVNGVFSGSTPIYYYSSSTTYSNSRVFNNIFLNTGTGGYGFNYSSSGNNNLSDYNTIFSANNNHFYGGTADTSLHNWRATKGLEAHSIVYNPGLQLDMRPDPGNPGVWAINGRAVHLAGNTIDKDGNPRVGKRADGVPDVGAFEVEPTVVPPVADASPADPLAATTQIFRFGQDTVARITWNPGMIVPTYVNVRCYSGRKAPNNFPVTANYMYFYTDFDAQPITYDFNPEVNYKDIWLGTIANESNLRIAKQIGTSPWIAYNTPLSSVNTATSVLTGNNFTSTGNFTGIEDGVLFSAIIVPNGSTVFCPGGSVQLDAANTGVGYTYQWYRNGTTPTEAIPGANGPSYIATQTGDYYVTISNGTTTATSNKVAVTIVAPPSANIAPSGPLTYCPGGQLSLTANAGLGLTYQWQFNGNDLPAPDGTSQTLAVTAAGNYTVTVRNIGCATTSSILPIVSGPLVVSLGRDTSFCESKPLLLDAGYPGAKYTWSTGDTTQMITVYNYSGDITVFVDAGVNCQDRDTINVHTDPLPSVQGISSTYLNGSTFTMTPSGEQNVSSYMWIHGNGGVDFTRTVTHTYNPNTPGEWNVLLVVFNDCGSDTTFLDLRTLVGVNDIDEQAEFTLYPNPATDHVTLSVVGKLTLSEVTVINHLGQVLYRGSTEAVKAEQIDVSSYANGHYIIRANTSDGKIISKPFDVVR
jgi:Nitrous oxidase accessory protein